MLIKFSVTNYRSVCDKQTLSMVATKPYNELEETNCFNSGVVSVPKLLRSATVYGPNAAGKSNIFHAVNFMRRFVLESHSYQKGQPIPVDPFLLVNGMQSAPSEFEIHFLQNNIRYLYEFFADRTRVTGERLVAFPRGRPQLWFERKYDTSGKKYDWKFGSRFSEQLRETWKMLTSENTLFLSRAVQNNSEQLKTVFTWFEKRFITIPPLGVERMSINLSPEWSSEKIKGKILNFVNAADIGIADFDIRHTSLPPIDEGLLPPAMPEELKQELIKGMPHLELRLHHRTDTGDVIPFPLRNESDGTRQLLHLVVPWLKACSGGHIILADELGTNLHPMIVRLMVGLIQNPEINKYNSQLIFSTHDTSILSADIFRRDQIWFVEKNVKQASGLYSLSDFKPRKGEAFNKGYLQGRYGALPSIGEVNL